MELRRAAGRAQNLAQRQRSEWKSGRLPGGGHHASWRECGGGEAGTEGGSGRERQSGAPATYTAHAAPAVHKSQVPVPAIAKVSPLAIPISEMKKPRLRKQKHLIPSGTKSQSQNLSPGGQNASLLPSLLPRFLTWIFTAAPLCSGLRAEQTQESHPHIAVHHQAGTVPGPLRASVSPL